MKKRCAPLFIGLQPASISSSLAKQANNSKDRKHEVILRRELYRLGVRYRKNVKHLLGKPDIVIYRARVVIFCDGDFWHGRNWNQLKLKLASGTNANYWVTKIYSNIKRDYKITKQLTASGWFVMRIWEKDIHNNCFNIAKKIFEIVQSRIENIDTVVLNNKLS